MNLGGRVAQRAARCHSTLLLSHVERQQHDLVVCEVVVCDGFGAWDGLRGSIVGCYDLYRQEDRMQQQVGECWRRVLRAIEVPEARRWCPLAVWSLKRSRSQRHRCHIQRRHLNCQFQRSQVQNCPPRGFLGDNHRVDGFRASNGNGGDGV